MNQIRLKMDKLKQNKQTALITYITAGDPNIETTEQIIYAKERGGADIIEIGIPHSDPVADGPVIQDAVQRALRAGTKIKDVFKCIERVRKNTQIPIAFLVYYNMVYAYGIKEFIQKCSQVGVDGLIIPDLPLEEREEIIPFINDTNIALIPLVAPTSKKRIEKVTKGGDGFIYCVSSMGVTGQRNEFHKDVDVFLQEVRNSTNLPIAVGFGISKKEDIIRFKNNADGVIVGSAIIDRIQKSNANIQEVENIVASFSAVKE